MSCGTRSRYFFSKLVFVGFQYRPLVNTTVTAPNSPLFDFTSQACKTQQKRCGARPLLRHRAEPTRNKTSGSDGVVHDRKNHRFVLGLLPPVRRDVEIHAENGTFAEDDMGSPLSAAHHTAHCRQQQASGRTKRCDCAPLSSPQRREASAVTMR